MSGARARAAADARARAHAAAPLCDFSPPASSARRRYKVCPFGAATQDSTSLGSFSGWRAAADAGAAAAAADANHTVMLFTGGQHCWNGPARSMTVTVECGEAEALHSVDEPEKCSYASKLSTPAACDAKFARALRLELDEEEPAPRDEL